MTEYNNNIQVESDDDSVYEDLIPQESRQKDYFR